MTCGDGCNTTGMANKDCFPIEIPPGDTEFGGKNCLVFVRSQASPAHGCQAGKW